MAVDKAPKWHGVVERWLERAAATGQSLARSVEVSVGRRSAEVLACLEVDVDAGERVDALAEQLIATLEDLSALSERTTVYTLRTRVRKGDDLRWPGLTFEVPISPPSSAAADAPSAHDKLIAQLAKHNEQLTAQLVTIAQSQHTGYAAVITALTGANRSLNSDLNEERSSRREYQAIAAEAVSKVEELNVELAKVDRDESKIKKLAGALLDAFIEKKDADGESIKAKVVSLVKDERKALTKGTTSAAADEKKGADNG